MSKIEKLHRMVDAKRSYDRYQSRTEFDLSEYLLKIGTSSNIYNLWTLIDDFCLEFGMTSACCRCFPSEAAAQPEVIYSRTLQIDPQLEAALLNAPSYLDPFYHAAIRSARPFHWLEIASILNGKSLQARYFDEQISSLGDGVIVPVFGPLSRDGYFCFHLAEEAEASPIDLIILHSIAQTTYLKMCEIRYAPKSASGVLSIREMQVITLLSKGLSNKQIAEDLGLSTNSVNTYVNRLFSKLDVTDRVTAAMRARTLGYVS